MHKIRYDIHFGLSQYATNWQHWIKWHFQVVANIGTDYVNNRLIFLWQQTESSITFFHEINYGRHHTLKTFKNYLKYAANVYIFVYFYRVLSVRELIGCSVLLINHHLVKYESIHWGRHLSKSKATTDK